MLDDFKILKKTEVEKARDNIVYSVSNLVYDTLGLNKMYRMGQIVMVESLLNCFKSSTDTFTKSDLIYVLEQFKKESDIDKDILTYIDALINKNK